ncbi:hypothetical protein WDW37_21160 [Bdellovibrionota bacterium FG-1]
MVSRVLLISERPEDQKMAEFVAFSNDLALERVVSPYLLPDVLAQHAESLIFWDADDPVRGEAVGAALANVVSPLRVFAVTDKPLFENPHLAKFPVFGHHLFRRFDEPAPMLLARLAGIILRGEPFGIARYFPEKADIRKIVIKRSGQKHAAVEAIQNIFVRQNVNTRLSALVAQAVDELLMNALFDAPVLPNGMALRRGTDRNADFELIEQEYVVVEVASIFDYIGICVADQFGSLKKSVLMNVLARNLPVDLAHVPSHDPTVSMGLKGIIQSGLSLVFASQPGVRTEVMLFFKPDTTYKDFRSGFRFLSLMMD